VVSVLRNLYNEEHEITKSELTVIAQ